MLIGQVKPDWNFRLWRLPEQQQISELRSCVLFLHFHFKIAPQPTPTSSTKAFGSYCEQKMPKKRQNNQIKTATGGDDDDDDARMDLASAEGEVDLEVANVAHQNDGANILAAIHLIKADFSIQLREVVASNQEIEEAIGAFTERLSAAESRIAKLKTTGQR